ncbi:hypothetical protein [Microtetraspora sp. NBRC 13810]|uniref:hypothetical protein n=1 Tax=Microtetraspora sp. NBRC 13810 TaxID=3030990 RepID=UPI0025563252|nr:hypothetical protein [Microtetraspora sp. NBRC 13810]
MRAAQQLCHTLDNQGIAAGFHAGFGLALIPVWPGLVVWSDGSRFWWRTGWDAERRRFTYDRHPATDPTHAALRIVTRYAQLRAGQSPPELLAEPPELLADPAGILAEEDSPAAR